MSVRVLAHPWRLASLRRRCKGFNEHRLHGYLTRLSSSIDTGAITRIPMARKRPLPQQRLLEPAWTQFKGEPMETRNDAQTSHGESSLRAEIHKQQPFDTPAQEAFLNLVGPRPSLMCPSSDCFEITGFQGRDVQRPANPPRIGVTGRVCNEIGQHLVARVPDVTRLIDRLEKQGYAEADPGRLGPPTRSRGHNPEWAGDPRPPRCPRPRGASAADGAHDRG